MNIDTRGIPDIQIGNIGTKKNPLFAVKGFVELKCWTGYYLYDDSYKLRETKVVTNGRIDLWIDHAVSEDGSYYIPREQVNAYVYLVEHQEEIKQSILEKLKKQFPVLLSEEYASWDREDPSFPKLSEFNPGFDFKKYIGPESINIGEDVKDDHAYISWHFRCTWDPEHGIEVITHKNKVIDIAPEADVYKIYKDNGTYEQVQEEDKKKLRKVPVKKKWWKFWK